MSSPSIPSTQSQWTRTVGSGLDGLKLHTDAAVPKPEKGEVLIRVRATSLNYRDLVIPAGKYPLPTTVTTVALSDGAGEVVALGENVTEFKVGDRVVAGFQPFYIAGDNRNRAAYTGALAGELPGMLTQYRALPVTAVVKLPDSISFEEASTLPCAGVTAWGALQRGLFPVRSDHSVLIEGTGGVSLAAAQIAKANGARVIATSSSDEKLARLVKLGLVAQGDTINYKKVADWGKKAKELTGGIGVDHVVEVGGQGTIHQAIEAVRADGEIVVIGFVGGSHPDLKVDPMRILGGGFMLRGIFVGPVSSLRELTETYAAHPELKPVVDKVFPFKQAKEAHEYLASGAHFGKVVITVD